MVELLFYDGFDCIGASMTRLTDGGTSLLHDVGANLDRRNLFFSDFLQPREFSALLDRQKLGLLPKINAILRPDYLSNEGLEADGDGVDAIFLTHDHVDHSGFLPFVRHDIPVYLTLESHKILGVMQEAASSYNTDYVRLKLRFTLDDKIRAEGLTARENMSVERSFRLIKPGEREQVGGIECTSYLVDHSIPGSVGMVYDTSAGAIAFSGDIRMRGWKGQRTIDFVERLREIEPRVLVFEGTRIDDTETISEKEIVERAAEIAKGLDGLLMVEWSRRNMDRLLTFHKVAKESGRILLVDPLNALLLERMDGYDGYPKLGNKRGNHLGIYVWGKGKGLLDKEWKEGQAYPLELVEKDYEHWERPFLEHKNRYTKKEVLESPDSFILYTEYSYLKHWPDFMGMRLGFIPSYPSPYDSTTEAQENIRQHWIRGMGIEAYPRLHVHGHMNYDEIKWAINTIRPEILIPVHTNHRESFRSMYDPEKIVMVEKESPFVL